MTSIRARKPVKSQGGEQAQRSESGDAEQTPTAAWTSRLAVVSAVVLVSLSPLLTYGRAADDSTHKSSGDTSAALHAGAENGSRDTLVAPHRGADPQTSKSKFGEIVQNRTTAGRRQRNLERKRFKSPHIILMDTMNFNKTVTRSGHDQLLVAFYDASSQSFKDLRPSLDDIANTLAQHKDAGDPLGALAACDISVNSYLGLRQAPEIRSSWQEVSPGSFRFGRPNFFPLIVIFYSEGMKVGEYRGVVSASQTVSFLRRHRAPKGGIVLENESSFRSFLKGGEPVLIGCGLTGNASTVFNQTAHLFHGEVMYGKASIKTCTEVLGEIQANGTVVWARGKGAALAGNFHATSDMDTLESPEKLALWFSSFPTEILEEMTPDNSHIYLGATRPLVILLIDPTNWKQRVDGESLFEDVQQQLQLGTFNFVWSDCKKFGYQFEIEKSCPAVVVVDSLDMDYKTLPLAKLYRKSSSSGDAGGANASSRLRNWLLKKSKPWRERDGLLAKASIVVNASEVNFSAAPGQSNASGLQGNGTSEERRRNDALLVTDDFMHQNLDIDDSGNITQSLLFAYQMYHSTLDHMIDIKRSYLLQYGHLKFDFSVLEEVQQMDKNLRRLVQTEDDVRKVTKDQKALKALWESIEARDKFRFKLSKGLKEVISESFMHTLAEAQEKLSSMYRRLFKFLHKHASQGTLGVPVKKAIDVDRRAADGLSLQEFLDKYARLGRPVIITGLNITDGEPWTMDFFKRHCNKSFVNINSINKSIHSWGRLDFAQAMSIGEFIDTFQSNETRRSWYLHDVSIPGDCPAALGPAPYRGFTMPKYFAGDYFQRAPFQGYQHTWPSLFVGGGGTESAMHIDSGGTNFWMHLLSGRKEWRFFSRDDMVNLYASVTQPSFYVDVFDADVQKYPLFKHAQMYTAMQEAGDLIFIPGGNPHGVRNLEDIHAISMNYVDASNVWLYLLTALSGNDWKSFELFTDGKSVPHGLLSSQQPMQFGEW